MNDLTSFDQNLPKYFALPIFQDQNVWNPSSFLNHQTITTPEVDRITNVSLMQTDDLLMNIFNNTSLTDYDPTDNFSDIIK